uniref:Fork-head domain-containing protein n=1 Tax=Oreochromis aureus TaxID=47969 RepID=A0A668RXR3_OREAU
MENSSHTLPHSCPSPATIRGPLPLSSSPHHTSSNGPISLPLSPISFPPSPASFSPATAESVHSCSPLSHFTVSHCLEGQSVADQDDLTCLSWLHQRGNLLPLQPLTKMTPLPQQEPSMASQLLPAALSKPPYSFSSLIFMAIEDSPQKRLPVKDIYEWIVNNFPYYKTATGGWRNSVRHNLSLSKSFRRIQRDKSQWGRDRCGVCVQSTGQRSSKCSGRPTVITATTATCYTSLHCWREKATRCLLSVIRWKYQIPFHTPSSCPPPIVRF